MRGEVLCVLRGPLSEGGGIHGRATEEGGGRVEEMRGGGAVVSRPEPAEAPATVHPEAPVHRNGNATPPWEGGREARRLFQFERR